MLKDYALESKGASITFSTSSHPSYQPECMIDGDDKSFFITTGTFPQTVILKLSEPVRTPKMSLRSNGCMYFYQALFIYLHPLHFVWLVKEFIIEIQANEEEDWKTITRASLSFFILFFYIFFLLFLNNVALEDAKGGLQNQTINIGQPTSHIRLTINSGYSEFVSIHKLTVTDKWNQK